MDAKLIAVIVIVDAIVIGLVLTKLVRRVPEAKAKELLRAGAKLIDVRSLEEFNSGHLRNAVNIPYNEISARITAVAPDKSKPSWAASPIFLTRI